MKVDLYIPKSQPSPSATRFDTALPKGEVLLNE
jgi:hypothetical protein